jgi:hypothetical protein
MKSTYPVIFLSFLVFLFFLLLLPTNAGSMLFDPDTGWHLAAGDLIRKSGLPIHDPWAFTTGDWPWYNISWAWDIALSYVYQHWGWSGVVAMNSVTIATTLALVFAASLVRSEHGIAAFLVTMMATFALISTNARSYQVSFAFVAMLSLMLSQISRGKAPLCWLFFIPAMMSIWVNVHGGFLAAFIVLGFHGLDTLLQKNYRLTAKLAAAGAASLAACLINPYGLHIIDATLCTLSSRLKPYINEWRPLSFTSADLMVHAYIIAFLFLVFMRKTPALKAEKWIAGLWLLLGVTSVRHLSIFGIVSAPLLAAPVRDILLRNLKQGSCAPLADKICALSTRVVETAAASCAMVVAAIALSAWLYTPQAAKLYDIEALNPLPDLLPEIAFLEKKYPHARMFNSYSLGGPLIFYAHGKVPVWIDGRAETAFPPQVISDYISFVAPDDKWVELFDRWHIDGAIIASHEPMAMDRFVSRRGWHIVFKGKDASIFMRDPL